MAGRVVLYVKTGCPYCAAKRRDLTARGVEFSEINVLIPPSMEEHPCSGSTG